METLLKVENLQVYYGMIQALKGVSFEVGRGEIVSLIGANGAGKTTTLHAITGLLRPKSGIVTYDGQDLLRVPPHKVVRLGIAHVPEGRRIFQGLTVYENLLLGAYSRKDKDEVEANMEMVLSQFPRLAERRKQLAGTLSGGEQQMLAMGRALLSNPEMIVLDEPSMGLSPLLVGEVFEIIESFREKGKTVLLVEQNAKKALAISDRAYVLENGEIAMSGKASELSDDERVRKAYLGA